MSDKPATISPLLSFSEPAANDFVESLNVLYLGKANNENRMRKPPKKIPTR